MDNDQVVKRLKILLFAAGFIAAVVIGVSIILFAV